MLRRRLASASLIASFLIATFVVARAAEPRALLELFTSQGCSSCPAADKLLGDLAADPSLVALSLPIDYWDYLGWKDTLANPGAFGAAARLRAHARRPASLYAANRCQRLDARARQRQTAIERTIVQTDPNTGVMSVPVPMIAGGNRSTSRSIRRRASIMPARFGCVRWRKRSPSPSAAARTARPPSPITMSCAVGSSSATGPAWHRLGTCRCRSSRPTASMPPRSWCRKARATSRESSWAPPIRRCA